MWNDQRSKRMVAVINCVINHSARAPECAVYPGLNSDVVDLLSKHGVGIIQMPCPEMVCLGLPRQRPDDASIRDVLDTPDGRAGCKRLAASVADQVEEFRRYGFAVDAILGGDVGSPGCAVHVGADQDGGPVFGERCGVFIRELLGELEQRGIRIPIRGIRDSARETLAEDLEWIQQVLTAAARA